MSREGQYRLLHSSISNSQRVRAVGKKMVKGDKWWRIGCHLLYTWLIKDEDDDRRLPGDPLWILANVLRYEELSLEEITEMLTELHRVKLIIWYEVNGDKFIQIVEKRDMQRIRKDRYKKSIYPAPSQSLLDDAIKEEILINSNGSENGAERQPNDNQLSANPQPERPNSATQSSSSTPTPTPTPTPSKPKDRRQTTDGLAESFEEFWMAYPKKRSKGQAEKAWFKIKPDEQLLATILAAVERAKTSVEWTKENGRFIPYPATWLNDKGWNDVYTPETDASPYDDTYDDFEISGSGKKLRDFKN